MKHRIAACLALLFAAGSARAATFDAAYMVAAPGSTTQVSEFAIIGPAPWLFVDLPGLGSFFTVVESDWFQIGVSGAQLSLFPSQQIGDLFWIGPAGAAWDGVKALGNWSITASFALVGILFAENGGIGVGISEGAGSTQVAFSVVPSPVPIPTSGLLFGAALSALGLGSRLRRAPA